MDLIMLQGVWVLSHESAMFATFRRGGRGDEANHYVLYISTSVRVSRRGYISDLSLRLVEQPVYHIIYHIKIFLWSRVCIRVARL